MSTERAVAAPGELVLYKLHGLGNDFLVVLDPAVLTGEQPIAAGVEHGPALARRLCDRHEGIGADGLIFGRRLSGTPAPAVLGFRLWNADGGGAEMSGNGIRCLAHAALDAGWVPEDEVFGVVTPAGRREVTVRRTSGVSAWGSVDMGPVKVRGEVERCNVGHGQLLVDVGNPHLVVLGPDPATVDLATLGPALEATDPAGLNVE
ncbi:MAG: hypothetical protein ACRDYY_13060, partial [Acidimicrobiales bacterium]